MTHNGVTTREFQFKDINSVNRFMEHVANAAVKTAEKHTIGFAPLKPAEFAVTFDITKNANGEVTQLRLIVSSGMK